MKESWKTGVGRRFVSAGMAVVLAAGMAPIAPAAVALADEGTLAAAVAPLADDDQGNVTYKLEDGVLTISGTGSMESVITDANGVAPWLRSDAYVDDSWNESTGISKVVIEEGVTSVEKNAFRYVTSLKEVSLPSTLTTIDAEAFRDCKGLAAINVPSTVKSIGRCAFYDCAALESLTLHEGTETIGSSAFENAGVQQVVIPASVTAISDSAFKGCASLTALTLSDGLKSIGPSAFFGCSKLSELKVPASVESIGNYAFQKCTNLATVVFDNAATTTEDSTFEGTAYLENMGDWAIVNGRLYQYKGNDEGTLEIPDTVTSIAAFAAKGNDKVTTLVIGPQVTFIGNRAFEKFPNLNTVVMQATKAPLLGSTAFGAADVDKLAIIIPENATGYNLTEVLILGDYPNWSYWCDYYNAGCVGTQKQIEALRAERAAAKQDAEKVAAAIQKLPSAANVTLSDEDAVQTAQTQFDALSEVGKGMVSTSLQTKLADVVARLAELKAAQAKEGLSIDAQFPDDVLRQIVLDKYDTDKNGKLSPDEIAGTAKLELSSSAGKVANLKGIEVFTGLTELYATDNEIESADLSALPKLKTLDLRNNKIAAIDLSKLPDLRKLYVGGNQLSTIDLSANGELTQLDAANNQLASVNVEKCEYLTALDVSNNRLAALDTSSLSLTTLRADGQALAAEYVGSTFDLATVAPGIVAGKVTGLSGAKLSGTLLTGLGSKATVTYTYACDDNNTMGVTLALTQNADKTAAAAVVDQIASLPAKAKLAVSDKAAVAAARASYDKLTASQKALVANAATLTAAEKQIADLEAAAKEAAEKAAAKEAADKAAHTIGAVKLAKTKVTYNGNAQKPKVTVTAKDGSKVPASGYTVKYAKNKNAGKATVTVTGKGAYSGTAKATFTVAKAKAKAKATTSKAYNAKALKKKAASFSPFKLTTDGKVAYGVVKKDAKKVLTFKAGKLSVKKGAKAGTYKVKVKVSAKAGKNYKALSAKTYTVTVKVS